MPTLTISLIVELSRPIVFHRWLPLKKPEDRIACSEEGVQLSITFSPESVRWAPSEEKIVSTVNLDTHRVMIEAEVEVSQTLADRMMRTERDTGPIADEYKELGRKIQGLVIKRINRLLAYARAVKGQFWLNELEPDYANPGGFFHSNDGRAAIDGTAIRFDPDQRIATVTGGLPSEVELMLTAEDWPAVRDFVIGVGRPPLVGSLLAAARHLAEQGSRRNALVEAVTALEVALGAFARRADTGKLARFRPGLEVASVKTLIEKVGLRGSFGVVIPLLFSETEFPSSLLEICRKAIEERNNVVHRGARDVDGILLSEMILAVERSCRILADYTGTNESD